MKRVQTQGGRSDSADSRSKRSRRARGDGGAALIEFAIIMPLLFLLLLGIIDFGFAFGDYIGVRNGVREGARLAVVDAIGPTTCPVVPDPDVGSPTDRTHGIICLTKERIGLNAADIKVSIALEDDPPASGDWVRICASYPAKSRSGFTAPFLNGQTIKSNTQMRMETGPTFIEFKEGGLTC